MALVTGAVSLPDRGAGDMTLPPMAIQPNLTLSVTATSTGLVAVVDAHHRSSPFRGAQRDRRVMMEVSSGLCSVLAEMDRVRRMRIAKPKAFPSLPSSFGL
jgi:hypothetical protein